MQLAQVGLSPNAPQLLANSVSGIVGRQETDTLMDSTVPAGAAVLLDLIGSIEAPKGYQTVYGNNQAKLSKPITSMTVGEVIAAGSSWTKRFGSSACGRYQFMKATLQGLVKEGACSASDTFDANLQDRLGLALLRRRGYDKFVAGKLSGELFGLGLAQEWASFPVLRARQGAHRKVARGETYYAGDKLNKSLVSPERIEACLTQVLVAEGRTPKTISPVPIAQPASAPGTAVATSTSMTSRLFGWFGLLPKVATPATVLAVNTAESSDLIQRVQRQLQGLGYAEVGLADGLRGPKLSAAVQAFRKEHGLPVSEAIDDALLSALMKASPRPVSEVRATAQAADLRAAGNEPAKAMHKMGLAGGGLSIFGLLGGLGDSGLLDGVKEGVTQANSILTTTQGAITTAQGAFVTAAGWVQWVFTHWWIFALLGGLYILYKVTVGVLNLVVLFRQGILARPK